LLVGNITYAEQVLAELGQVDPDQIAYQYESAYFAMIRLWLVQGKFQKAIPLLEGVKTNARQGGRVYTLIEALILQASAEAMQGHKQAAQQRLAQAIALAEPEGFIRIFVVEGAVVRNLLEERLSNGQGSPYIQQLIAAFDSTLEPSHADKRKIGLIEPFSERELQVLRLLRTHLSQQEMEDELCVSVNTIRFHTKNIYRKLGAHERSEAVGKAKAAGLL
jgi:LuxR family maltose regulon positive regulatory protein